jgi:Bacterial archaeo-eukaryotic release factor family 2
VRCASSSRSRGIDESVTAEIGQAIMELRPPIGRSGRAVVAGATGVVVNEHLLRPTAETVVRVSELPYIVPILEQGFDSSDYLLVVVDHTGADITVHTDVSPRSETVGDGGYPARKASGAETAGYGEPQLRTDEAARKNVRTVADRARELVDETGAGVVFVVVAPADTPHCRTANLFGDSATVDLAAIFLRTNPMRRSDTWRKDPLFGTRNQTWSRPPRS